MNNFTTVQGRWEILKHNKMFPPLTDKTSFDSNFKESPWRSRTSGNLSRNRCAWKKCARHLAGRMRPAGVVWPPPPPLF